MAREMFRTSARRFPFRWVATIGLLCLAAGGALGQDRLPKMPGYERYARLRPEIASAIKNTRLSAVWTPDGKAFGYRLNGKNYRYDLAAHKAVEVETPVVGSPGRVGRDRGFGGFPERGRQFASTLSPDKKRKAYYKDHNLWLSDADGANPTPITQDGSAQNRIKYGTASWVYGEELEQRTAFWWSPDSKKIAYYRFDESKVKDYYLAMHTLETQDTLDAEPYPKAGAPNPIVALALYDVETKKTVQADARDGKPFDDTVVGHYVYSARWSPDGKELLFNRANRRQNILEIVACDPETGKCRVLVREEWPASWTENRPALQFLKDGKRFILASERAGWRNLYLYDLSGKLLATLTHHDFDVDTIVRVDEQAGLLYYMARSGDNYLKLQLHRVGLDGKGDRRLTDPALNHSIDLAPDGKHFLDTAQSHDTPPVTRLVNAEGQVVQTLAQSDTSKFEALGLQKAELFTYKAADGKTDLYGILRKPSNFDPNKKYPLLVDVYAGPESGALSETFTPPPAYTELGFLVAEFDGRGVKGRGKRFMDALYRKLGVVEIDDQAEGVKFLRQRPYVDGGRVGIFGTSYGGYAAVMCLLRYPDVFQAASASSSVTDWRNYDTIYTERYMGTPQDNKTGYDAGSAMTYADKLQGRLLLYFGTADNNVHPANTHQLVAALQEAGKSFEVQIGPDQEHSGVNFTHMMEFFIENLVQKSPETP